MADPWDKELNKPKTTLEPSPSVTPTTPTVPVLLDERSNTGVPRQRSETSSSTRQSLDRFPGVGEDERSNLDRFPDVGFDVIVQDDDGLNQGDRDAGPGGIISNVQTKLNALGLDVGDVDGVIGGKTSRAIQDAQEMLGLPRTGVLDKKTRLGLITLSPDQINFLKNNPKSWPYQNLGENVPVTTVEENVVETEAMAAPVEIEATPVDKTTAEPVEPANFWTKEKVLSLNSTNRNAVREVQSILGTTVDGSFGSGTSKAIADFQRDNGLEVTGAVDNPETYTALRKKALTDNTNPAFYGTPAPVSPVSLVTETPWSTDETPSQQRWRVNGMKKPLDVKGVKRTYSVGDDTINIINLTEATSGSDVMRTLSKHTPTRIIFHNTGSVYGDRGVIGFMDAQGYATAQFFIDKSGQIFEVTPAEYMGNHAAGMQKGSVGIEIEGFPEMHTETTPENMSTPEQDAAAALLGVYLINRYPTINQALSHREVGLYDHDKNRTTPLKKSRKTDGWTALRAFRLLVGQTGYDMGKRNNIDTFMGLKVKVAGYFQ